MRQQGIEQADTLFKTNDEWQRWRGDKGRLDYVIDSYPVLSLDLLDRIESNDPTIVFPDEEGDDGRNSLED